MASENIDSMFNEYGHNDINDEKNASKGQKKLFNDVNTKEELPQLYMSFVPKMTID